MRYDLWRQFCLLWGASALVVGLTQWHDVVAPSGRPVGGRLVRAAPDAGDAALPPPSVEEHALLDGDDRASGGDHLGHIVSGRRLAVPMR